MKMKRIWPLAVTAIFAVLAILFLRHHPAALHPLKDISPTVLVWLAASRIVFLILNGLTLRDAASKFGVILTPKEWIGLPFVTAMGNYVTPFSGGMLARATYLKYRHRFPYARFVSVLGVSLFILFWVAALAGVVILIATPRGAGSHWEFKALFTAITIGVSGLLLLPTVRVPGTGRLSAAVNSSLEGWDAIKGDYRLLARLALWALAGLLMNGISFWLAFAGLYGASVPVDGVFLISLFSIFFIIVRITPSNLGVFEGAVMLGAGIAGIGAGAGLMASLLIRAASLIPIFTLGPIFSYVLTRELTGTKE